MFGNNNLFNIPSLKISHPEKSGRREFLKKIPVNSIIAEIGVHEGGHAKIMREICQPKEFILVDCWKFVGGTETDEWKEIIEKRYEKVINEFPECHIIKGFSSNVSSYFEDQYFDAVYIDAGHSYEDVSQDIRSWYPKVKVGGILCGHDFCFSNNCKLYKLKSNELSPIDMWITPVSGSFCVGEQSTHSAHANGDVVTAVFNFAQNFKLDLEIFYQSSKHHEGRERMVESYEWLVVKK